MKIKADIARFIREELLDGENVGDDDDLLVDGMVDSIGMMRLMIFLEESLGISVPPEDFTIEHFGSINAMGDYLLQRLESRSNS